MKTQTTSKQASKEVIDYKALYEKAQEKIVALSKAPIKKTLVYSEESKLKSHMHLDLDSDLSNFLLNTESPKLKAFIVSQNLESKEVCVKQEFRAFLKNALLDFIKSQ